MTMTKDEIELLIRPEGSISEEDLKMTKHSKTHTPTAGEVACIQATRSSHSPFATTLKQAAQQEHAEDGPTRRERMLREIAEEITPSHREQNDIVSVLRLGLVKAVDFTISSDPLLGRKISSFFGLGYSDRAPAINSHTEWHVV